MIYLGMSKFIPNITIYGEYFKNILREVHMSKVKTGSACLQMWEIPSEISAIMEVFKNASLRIDIVKRSVETRLSEVSKMAIVFSPQTKTESSIMSDELPLQDQKDVSTVENSNSVNAAIPELPEMRKNIISIMGQQALTLKEVMVLVNETNPKRMRSTLDNMANKHVLVKGQNNEREATWQVATIMDRLTFRI